ncbi:NADH:flavin oxidoreductase [Rhizobiaceae bacterium BDR2-2]|uniref:NADH:flavin oxidoreductase n=1 Tax=Ectorhizobium quercum TaxID=2965071 RepID=A0AAE3SUW0_9HYPH|nr:NADH:flavin oxidoreductase [Ectorhizobium quercum]MCX8995710.1 NADH:flavin oxidoreductase [Ectorhizobium quercum]
MDTPFTLAPLFEPFTIGRTTLSNRIVMAPMTRQKSPGGVPGVDVTAYYRRRAEGGVGLIITEGTYIDHPAANAFADGPDFFGEAALDGWRRVVDAVHDAGGKIIPQLWHCGPERRPGMPHDPAVPGYGPVELRDNDRVLVHAMTPADIAAVTDAYVRGARTAERLGFDGVEIHAAHEFLLDTFLWAGSNTRIDDYGGSIEKRLRFPLEVVRAVRQNVSADFPVVLRFCQFKRSDYGARIAENPEDLARILKPLAQAGVDVFHASERRFREPAFAESPDNLASWAKTLTGKPVITVGSVGLKNPGEGDPGVMSSAPADLRLVAERLRAGAFDLVGVGRALLADPFWAARVRDGRFSELKDYDPVILSGPLV